MGHYVTDLTKLDLPRLIFPYRHRQDAEVAMPCVRPMLSYPSGSLFWRWSDHVVYEGEEDPCDMESPSHVHKASFAPGRFRNVECQLRKSELGY